MPACGLGIVQDTLPYRETVYHITVLQTSDGSAAGVIVDGVEQPDKAITLVDDHQEHSVEVRMPLHFSDKEKGIKR